MERVVKTSESNDDWSIKFWQKAGVKQRFATAWKMLEDYEKIKGKNGNKIRLRRNIENIQRI